MNEKRVFYGILTWFLGLLLPVLHHTLLMHAAVQSSSYSYSYANMCKYFFDLPWLHWLYMVGMIVVGLSLILSGMRDHT
jgi:hypothetical protein